MGGCPSSVKFFESETVKNPSGGPPHPLSLVVVKGRAWCTRPGAKALAVVGALALFVAGADWVNAATDPRVVERYREMIAANPMDETALDRLWKIAQQDGSGQALLDDYCKKAAGADFSSQMIWAQLLHRAGREDESREAFLHAATIDPKSALPHLALGGVLAAAEAAPELEKAAALLPPDSSILPGTLQKLGDAWMTAGQPDKAAAAWEQIVAMAPDNLELRQRLAAIYADKGMAALAAGHYAYLDQHGDSATRANALRSLARLHQSLGDTDSALDAFGKALALTAPDNWLHGQLVLEMVRASQGANRVQELETRWNKEVDANPRATGPWLQLAELYEQQGDLPAERRALEKASALVPGDLALKIRLGRLLVRLDDLTGATAQIDAVLAAGKAASRQPDTDLVFERAELDIRRGDAAAAQARVEELMAKHPTGGSGNSRPDETLSARALTFFQRYRMADAIEKHLRKPEADPAALADFLFSQHRSAEAQAALHRLVHPGDPPRQQADARERVAALLKQAGEPAAAIVELQETVKLQPDSRRLWLLLGDALLTTDDPQLAAPAAVQSARESYTRAFALSHTDEERVEADQRLFRTFQRSAAPLPEAPASGAGLISAARRMAAALLAAPVAEASPGAPENTLLQKFIKALENTAYQTKEQAGSEAWLRLARWQFWSRDLGTAQAAANQAISLAPDSAPPRELAVAIATASGNRTGAVAQLRQLIQVAPDRKESFLKQIAQADLQMGRKEEALQILSDLAKSGVPGAIADLARAQQQADQWYDALDTWQQLYKAELRGHHSETLQPLVRAMERLEMHQRAGELLWDAFQEQTEEPARSAVLHDLIAHCHDHGTMNWLLEKLQTRAGTSSNPSDTIALAAALKADGRLEEASRQLEGAALSASDRPAAEGELARQAEALRDFPQAVKHQRLRLTLLPTPAVADWEKLAALQEFALDYPAAEATHDEIVRRFPRDSEALLACARYFEKWGRPERAREILRSVHGFDRGNIPAAAALARLASAARPRTTRDRNEGIEAAEAVLSQTQPARASDGLVLPPAGVALAGRVQAYLATYRDASVDGDCTVSIADDRTPVTTEHEWRLEAIRCLAASMRDTGSVDGSAGIVPASKPVGGQDARPPITEWLSRWKDSTAPSERLWALYYAGARKEVFAQMLDFLNHAPSSVTRRFALVWTALEMSDWEELGAWLWAPERVADDHEAFRMALGEWCALGAPLGLDALFAKATPGQLWSCAEVLANRHRLTDAIKLGRRVFDVAPSPRGATGLTLANWMLANGDLFASRPVLRAVATEPANSLDAPTYAAQRALFLQTPEDGRDAWVEQFIAELDPSPSDPTDPGAPVISGTPAHPVSPVHVALSSALLWSLAGDTNAANDALDRLVALRFGPGKDTSSTERVWGFLLATGVQFQLWHLDDAAESLWESALADDAAIQLQGNQAISFAGEIRTRLAAIKLTQAPPAEAAQQLDEITGDLSVAGLNQLAAILENSGFRAEALTVLDLIQERDPKMPLPQLLSLCAAIGDKATAETAIDSWMSQQTDDIVSGLAALDFLKAHDPARALKLAETLVAGNPNDPRLLTALARIQQLESKWTEAERTLRKLLVAQPANAEVRLELADVLTAQNRRDAALDLLKSAPQRALPLDARIVELTDASGAHAKARLLATDLVRGTDSALLQQIADRFAQQGHKPDGLALLTSAAEAASEAHEVRGAFNLQQKAVRFYGPGPDGDPAIRASLLRRLRVLAAGRPELVSAYFDLTADSHWQPRDKRKDELLADWDEGRGSTVAGAWIVQDLLEAGQPQAAATVITSLLKRGDVQESLLTWLDDRCKRANRHDLALTVTEGLMKRNPSEVDYAIRHARSLHAIGREEETAAVLERAALRSVFAPDLAGRIGLVALELGNSSLARELFDKAVDADPAAQQSDVYLGYARLLLAEHDFPGAKRLLRDAFRNPANDKAGAIVEYLHQSGRPVATELRDLELRTEVAGEVQRRMKEGKSEQ